MSDDIVLAASRGARLYLTPRRSVDGTFPMVTITLETDDGERASALLGHSAVRSLTGRLLWLLTHHFLHPWLFARPPLERHADEPVAPPRAIRGWAGPGAPAGDVGAAVQARACRGHEPALRERGKPPASWVAAAKGGRP